ncbi:hypothetical protein ACSSV1_005270 [Labrenzia sp. MBR-25]|jgi:hypothetical protein
MRSLDAIGELKDVKRICPPLSGLEPACPLPFFDFVDLSPGYYWQLTPYDFTHSTSLPRHRALLFLDAALLKARTSFFVKWFCSLWRVRCTAVR